MVRQVNYIAPYLIYFKKHLVDEKSFLSREWLIISRLKFVESGSKTQASINHIMSYTSYKLLGNLEAASFLDVLDEARKQAAFANQRLFERTFAKIGVVLKNVCQLKAVP